MMFWLVICTDISAEHTATIFWVVKANKLLGEMFQVIVVARNKRGGMWWVESCRAYWRQRKGKKEEEMMIK